MSWDDYAIDAVEADIAAYEAYVSGSGDYAIGGVEDFIDVYGALLETADDYVIEAVNAEIANYNYVTYGAVDYMIDQVEADIAAYWASYKASSDIAIDNVEADIAAYNAFIVEMGQDLATRISKVTDKIPELLTQAKDKVIDWLEINLRKISEGFALGFEYLALRLEDLLEIPARAFFELLYDILPGEEE